jgi:hypothetical protein
METITKVWHQKRLMEFVDAEIVGFSIILFGTALIFFVVDPAVDVITEILKKDPSFAQYYTGDYPNKFSFQYVLPDKNQRLENGQYSEYNVAIEMRARSFSARVPIKVNVDLLYNNSTLPPNWMRFNQMYIVFEGSRNEPPKTTSLGSGHYVGYVVANITRVSGDLIYYSGTDTI